MREVIQQALSKAHRLFTYVSDEKNYGQNEHMTSHYDAYSLGEEFSDDCDGFAITLANVLVKDLSIAPSEVSLVICDIGYAKHMVCSVNIDDQSYILDCNYKRLYKPESKDYDWMYTMSLDDLGNWYRIK